ncbi:cytochrome P450 84A1-like [Macadamia integrifolia]|uniref:cytochrome P450 84A1-like n=1 Tax=Macadamia integrifolia TaxID=60698 RepID=UPI001C4F734D|nr:cytochrome P450 84A1-like [Macadamia integrifolia]
MDYSALLQPTPMLFLFVLPLLFLFGMLLRGRKKLPYPPGPKGLPIIGNMNMLDQLNHRGFSKLAKQYGGLLHLRLGGLHVVVASTPEMARQVLQAQDINFSNRPLNIAIKYLSYDQADMAFAHYGSFWRQMRKVCVMRLFSRRRAESWASVRDEVDSMIHTLVSQAGEGKSINVGSLFFSLAMNITYRAAFGSDVLEGQEKFVSIMQEFSHLFGVFNLADFIPWLGWADPHGRRIHKTLVKARNSLDVFIDKIIDDHLEKRKSSNRSDDDDVETDMVDDLLAFYTEEEPQKSGESADLQGSITLTRDNIKGIIMDVMFGGTETIASLIEWTVTELLKSPEHMKRVQQELEDVIGLDRIFQESDLENLPYFRATIKETLRLHPPLPVLLHAAAEDAEVGGYTIPKGARVLVNVWQIGRDKDSWEEPETYNPARFMSDDAPNYKGNNFEYLPFSSGRRSCPGMQLGMYALELALGHLLHNFKWELPNGLKPSDIDMSDSSGITTPKAVQLVAVPTIRLTCPIL